MPYKSEIIAAFWKWDKSEKKIPAEEYLPHYKTRSAAARKNWKIFSGLCKDNSLNPVTVSHEINGLHNLRIKI